MQFPTCPRPAMRESEAKEKGRHLTNTLGHKMPQGSVIWLLKYAKGEARNSQPISKPTNTVLSEPFTAKTHH